MTRPSCARAAGLAAAVALTSVAQAAPSPASPPAPRTITISTARTALVLAVVAYGVWSIGPRNVIGMLRYDQRQEGKLVVGHLAPDTELVALDGSTPVRLQDRIGGKPLVLVFGSFT